MGSLNFELLHFLQVFIDLSQALSVVGGRTISDIQLLQVEIQQRTPIHRIAARRFSPIKVAVVLLGDLKVDNKGRFALLRITTLKPKDVAERQQFLESATTFLVVRHPFERLLSAFMASVKIQNQ